MRFSTTSALLLLSVQNYNVNGFGAVKCQYNSNPHTSQRNTCNSFISSSSSSSSSTSLFASSSGQTEAEKLLEKAAEIRKQLAELEGKTLTQVEEEAKEQKETQIRLKAEADAASKSSSSSKSSNSNDRKKNGSRANTQVIYVPESIEDQTRQAAYAIERAFQDGITRQSVRLALVKPDSPITPEEEEWPGGSKQMYREAGRPLTEALLSEIRAVATNLQTDEEKNSGKEFFPPAVKAQDIWDFDGSALISAEAASGPSGDVQALVFPNTDVKYLKDITEIDANIGKDRLFLLVNPFWRNVESWGFNILQPRGKQKAQETIFDNKNGGYQETYVLSRFSVRGEDCVSLKVYPNDWQLFAYIEDYTYGRPIQNAIRLGSMEEEPSSADFAKLINEREEFKMNKTMRQLNQFKN